MSDLSRAYRQGQTITPEMIYDRFPQGGLFEDTRKIVIRDFRRIMKSLYEAQGRYRFDSYRNIFVPNKTYQDLEEELLRRK